MLGDRAFDRRLERAGADDHPAPRPVPRVRLRARRARPSARREHVEALVELEPADAQQARSRRRRCRAAARISAAVGGAGQRGRLDRDRCRSGIVRICARRGWRCRATVGSSDASVAMMQSAARAQTRDGPPQRRVAEALQARLARAVAPNSSRPCGLRTSGAGSGAAPAAYRARWRRIRARCRRGPRARAIGASRPARKPKSGYAVLRSSIVVPRRLANGKVRYGTCRIVMRGEANGSLARSMRRAGRGRRRSA